MKFSDTYNVHFRTQKFNVCLETGLTIAIKMSANLFSGNIGSYVTLGPGGHLNSSNRLLTERYQAANSRSDWFKAPWMRIIDLHFRPFYPARIYSLCTFGVRRSYRFIFSRVGSDSIVVDSLMVTLFFLRCQRQQGGRICKQVDHLEYSIALIKWKLFHSMTN